MQPVILFSTPTPEPYEAAYQREMFSVLHLPEDVCVQVQPTTPSADTCKTGNGRQHAQYHC